MDPIPGDFDTEFVEVSRYVRLADARENALVLVARGIPYVVVRLDDEWAIKVDFSRIEEARLELMQYQGEVDRRPVEVVVLQNEPGIRVQFWSLPLVAMLFVGMSVLQAEWGAEWEKQGILVSEQVVRGGEWWRLVTALTLHGDVPHVVANLLGGLLFAGLLLPRFGQGVTWLMVLLSGTLGNFLNSLIYVNEVHRSLGASTGVFGALGLMTGDALGEVLKHRSGVSWWRWVLPLGAGLALLAFLGAGGQSARNVDVLAHLWGFLAGLLLGGSYRWFSPVIVVRGIGQIVCGCAALTVLFVCWCWAMWAVKTA